MKGAIIGDIAGSAYEFNNTNDYNFEMFGPRARFTDDSVCTIAIMSALTHGIDFETSVVRWCKRYPGVGYSRLFNEWVHNDKRHPYGSCGNGSAMRVSPIGFLFDDQQDVEHQAMESARISHSHPEGIAGAVCVARAISVLKRHLKNGKKAAERLADYYYPGFMSWYFPSGFFDATCAYCVPLAFRIFLDSTSFEDAIRKAVTYGGDSDTLGSIVGSLAEAFYGVPGDLWDKAKELLTDDMIAETEAFYDKIKSA